VDGTVSICGQLDVRQPAGNRWPVTEDDLSRLVNGQLNDSIVNAYLLEHLKSPPNVKVQNSFFYHSLDKDWAFELDVSSHDYFLVPICHSRHWSLSIVCHPSSLHGPVEDGKAFRILSLNTLKNTHLDVTNLLKHHFCEVMSRRVGC
jgi:Ulp1 family protease